MKPFVRYPRFGSLKLRIAALYTGLFAVALSVIVIIASNGLERFGQSTATRDLASNARVFDEVLDLRAGQMRDAADVLARDFGFREAVATDDGPTIESALASLEARSGARAAFIVTQGGELIALDNRTDLPAADRLWTQLDAQMAKGIIRLGDTLALAAAAPIQAPDLIGWLVLAQPLDTAELDRLSALAAVDISTTVTTRSALPGWLGNASTSRTIEREVDGERQLFQSSTLPALEEGLDPRLVLSHSLTDSLAPFVKLQTLLVLLGFVALGLVVILSWHVARSVTRPLRKLDSAAQAISEGREVLLVPETDDEIGRLATSFNQMVDAIEQREREIAHVGLHDGLTDLPNRKFFVEQLEQALRHRGEDERLMVLYVDLDDFKAVNDTLGHPAGDAMLRTLAAHLTGCLPRALIARLGGDEFAILVEGITPSEEVAGIARHVHECFGKLIEIEGHTVDCSASLGIAVAPGDGREGTALMKHADLALYRAKADGKATYHFFEPSLDEKAQRRRRMEMDLRLALRDGGFELYFQPLHSIAENRIRGFEALIRWPHPEFGMISPAEFIPLAEETGLIIPIGEWVVREACRRAASWPDDLFVAVNISPKQFSGAGLTALILNALATAGLPPQRLELEITESVFISEIDKTLATLHSLRDIGVRIALDDFGTGYSSLSYLRSFPFDKVKIDRSFVTDLAEGDTGHAIIRAVTALAAALNMETLAEGVEEPEQLEVLTREGCGYIQGFLFGRPLPPAELAALLAEFAQDHGHLAKAG